MGIIQLISKAKACVLICVFCILKSKVFVYLHAIVEIHLTTIVQTNYVNTVLLSGNLIALNAKSCFLMITVTYY